MMMPHVGNFLHCMRTREKPHLDVETAAHAQILINLAVESYRDNKVRVLGCRRTGNRSIIQ